MLCFEHMVAHKHDCIVPELHDRRLTALLQRRFVSATCTIARPMT